MEGPRLVALGLLTSGERVLLLRRPPTGRLPGQWEFPGGTVEWGEHPWDALRRELREELGVLARRGALFGIYSHIYAFEKDEAHVVLVAYRLRVPRRTVPEAEDRRWVALEDLPRWDIVAGSRPILQDLRRARELT